MNKTATGGGGEVMNELNDLAHEIWAAAQLLPGEGIEDGVARVEALLPSRYYPRCRDCRWFIPRKPSVWGPWRQCAVACVEDEGPDFGCVHQEGKE